MDVYMSAFFMTYSVANGILNMCIVHFCVEYTFVQNFIWFSFLKFLFFPFSL